MSNQSESEDLGELFVAVTGEEGVTEGQDAGTREPVEGEPEVVTAVADGLEDAIDGSGRDTGDPAG